MRWVFLAEDDFGEEPQKEFPEDFSKVEADGHGDGVDLVAKDATQPVARPDFTVVFAMADDRFDRISALLTFAFYGRDAAFLARQNDLGFALARIDSVAAIPQIDLRFFRRNPAERLNLREHAAECVPIIRPSVMRNCCDNEVAFIR